MSEALEAALECFAGRRTAQGDPMRHRFAVLPSRQEPRYLLPLGDSRTTLEGFRVYTPLWVRRTVAQGFARTDRQNGLARLGDAPAVRRRTAGAEGPGHQCDG